MAKNDNTPRTHHTRHNDGDRERRRDVVVNTVKERPYTAAALATVAAGAAAFFLTRGKSDKPLMNWGQNAQGDHVKGASAFKSGATTSDRSLETVGAATTSPMGDASVSPSAAQAASLAASATSTNAAASGGTGTSTSPAGANSALKAPTGKTADAGIDEAAKTETKVGAISYGA